VNPTEEEEAEALATPLLAGTATAPPSEADEFGAQLREYLSARSMATVSPAGESTASTSENNNNNNTNNNISMMSMALGTAATTPGGHGHTGHHSIARSTVAWCLRTRTLADALPPMLQPLVANGKTSVLFFLGGQLVLLLLWLPFWIGAWLLSEAGVWAASLITVVLVGRGVLRMIAFPGSSHRVSGEIEKEFAKYSVKVLVSSATSLCELAAAFKAASKKSSSGMGMGNRHNYELESLWSRAKSYRDRVLGVYAEVLRTTITAAGTGTNTTAGASQSQSQSPYSDRSLNKYGNNVLVGDVGNLSGLTPEAIADGVALLNQLETVLERMTHLEDQANAQGSSPSDTSFHAASSLETAATDLLNFVESLRPPLAGATPGSAAAASASMERGDGDYDESNNELRRRLEQEDEPPGSGSITDTIKMGLSSILPMLDPPLHSSIFGLDVLRGCVLSRYMGARQLWIPRPGGGQIDCFHIPSPSNANATTNANANASSVVAPVGSPNSNANSHNSKAVVYCNPNAGLIEVATGMSLAGGNVATETDQVANDNCWTDFYTNEGFDIYLYNYAGFGRSHGRAFGSSNEATPHTPGAWGRVKRIVHGLFFSFGPTPDSLRADGLAVASHVLSRTGVESLVIHGESIGGLAASGTARKLTTETHHGPKVSMLLCDRTFCNLEAVAQRLVGGWSGYAIRLLAPLWSTDVVGDFLAATCPKVVATDSADAIIADSSSLKAGISFWKEIQRSASSTKGIGWIMDAPLHYKMADWENVGVAASSYVSQPRAALLVAPVWPSDKHISLDEAFHFAACAKRIGKLASIEKKRTSVPMMDGSGELNGNACQAPIYLVWKYLGCCEGLCGSALGVVVKGGFDTTVSWLSSMCVFGGQTVVEGIEHRCNWSNEEACAMTKLGQLQTAIDPRDFDCRPPGYEQQESDASVHPKPIPEVLEALKAIVEGNPADAMLNSVSHEVAFVIGTLEYVMLRLSAPTILETSWKNRHLNGNGSMTEGSFMNLHCGHNNPFSPDERKRLRDLLQSATVAREPLPAIV